MKLNKKQIGIVLIAALLLGFIGAYLGIVLIAALLLGFIGAYLGVNLAQSNQSATPGGKPGKEIPFSNENNSDSPEDMEKVSQAYSLIKEHFIEDIGDQDLVEGAIQGMLTSLDDPYSTYMDVEEMEESFELVCRLLLEKKKRNRDS